MLDAAEASLSPWDVAINLSLVQRAIDYAFMLEPTQPGGEAVLLAQFGIAHTDPWGDMMALTLIDRAIDYYWQVGAGHPEYGAMILQQLGLVGVPEGIA